MFVLAVGHQLSNSGTNEMMVTDRVYCKVW